MSKTEESVFFIVEIEKYIYANTRRFNSGIHYQDLCGVPLMCRYQPVLTHMLEI